MEGEIWELTDAHCALLQGLQKTQHRCLEPPGEARPRGSAAEKPQPPAQVTGQPLGPAQGSLGPCSQEMPVGDTVGALGDPPASRPSDVFSIKGDVITGAMTPLHAVLGQPKVSFQQPPCPRWVTLFIHVGGGEGRGKQSSPPDRCKHQGTPDLPPSLQGPPAGRGPVYWVVETVSGQWRSMPFSHRMMLCVCVHATCARSVVSNSLRHQGLKPTRLLCPWDSPGQNTGLGCRLLLQGIFLTQRRRRSPALASRFFTI